jgi:hypothetical protein
LLGRRYDGAWKKMMVAWKKIRRGQEERNQKRKTIDQQ